MFDKDLEMIFSDSFMHSVTVVTGGLKDQIIKGMFDTNNLKRSLEGVEIATKGAMFTTIQSSIEGLSDEDAVEFRGERYQVQRILRDATGMARVEFEEVLSGNPSGELIVDELD